MRRNKRELIWEDKQVRGPRDQRQKASCWISIWGNQLGVLKILQATDKVCTLRSETKMRRAERHGESASCLLHFPGLPAFCFSSKGSFIFTLNVPSVIFLLDSLWNPSMCWSDGNLCIFLPGNRNCGWPGSLSCRQFSPSNLMSKVSLGDCATHISAAGHWRLLPVAYKQMQQGNGRNVTNTLLWG